MRILAVLLAFMVLPVPAKVAAEVAANAPGPVPRNSAAEVPEPTSRSRLPSTRSRMRRQNVTPWA